ncbi:MAG TPA: energy-coupling factor ABC transporter permease [Burkholderiales bacterium]|jgi:uncharacterized membrane protein|nr:energy-coupling factor ABC transporter permease [Burkholderiales bacterium]
MDLPQGLPGSWLLVAWVVLVPLAAWSVLSAPWSRLKANEQSHVFLGAIVAVAALWSIGGRVGPLLHFHLLGATLLYLLFGLPLALVAIALAAAAATLAWTGDWPAVGARVLLAGAVPVFVSHAVLKIAEARLPANFFVYVFGGGFFGGALAMAAASAAATGAIALSSPGDATPVDAWTAMVLMLASGEATLTGMLITLFVVYKPAWVGTFRDEVYLRRRQ